MKPKKNIDEIVDGLIKYIEKNNRYGYDLYDLYNVPIFLSLLGIKPIIFRKIINKILFWIIIIFPNLIVSIFNVKKNINPKAMGLLLKAYCNLYHIRNDKCYLDLANDVASWLMENKSDGYQNCCWGYPFNWQSKIYIPKFTPSSVVSSIVGDGFFSLYKITKNPKYLEICESICLFFINDLNKNNIDQSKICFSYTPIDNYHVHNANLFTAEFLIRIGKEINNNQFIEFGRKAANYTISEQNSDGSILYWGDEDEKFRKYSFSNMDHYHSGFEIRMIYKIAKLLSDKKMMEAYKRYYSFYKKNFFLKSFIKYRPNKKYPIDIHSCSEAIICNSIVENGLYANESWLYKTVDWINKKMLNENGLYIYQIQKLLIFEYKVKVYFLRWGQAWMLLALTEFLLNQKNEN